MQSIIDASSAVCESAGIKRAASPLSPCVSSSAEHHRPLPQHEFPCPTGQVCQHKRLRTSNPHPILKTQNTPAASARSPPIVWRDFRNREFKMVKDARKPDYEALDPRDRMSNMIAKTATPFTSTQHSRPGMEPQGPSDSKPHGRLRNFFTKASIKTPRGIVDLERVQVDERSPFNLVPWSIATNLDLMLYSGKTWAITIADRLVRTNQYSQFTIRVAGHNTTINTGVIYGLQTILLGREWIRSVHLLNDFGNQNYYIPVPLAVEAAEEKFPGIVDTEVEAKDVKPVEMVTPDEIAEEHDDDEFSKADCGDDDSSNGRSSLDDDPFSESEPSFDGQTLSDGDTPFDEPSLGDDTLSDGGTSSEGPIFGEDEVTPTDEDGEDDEVDEHDQDHDEDDEDGNEDDHKDEDENDDGDDDGDDDENDNEDDDEDDDIFCEDYEGYKGHEGKVCDECVGYDECEGCDECEGYDECEGCEECKGYDECEGCEECEGNEEYGEFREGHEYQEGEEDPDDNLQDFVEQYTHLERFVDIEQTKEAYRQHSESKGEPALPSSYQIVSLESALSDPTKSQVNVVQARITKRQTKEIANILNHISRTPAGQSFKAPVEQLWPECADAYAAEVPNPIDLGTIQVKVKNNIYASVDDFRADVVLLYQNSVDFNGIDHIITSAALEVRETILNAINDMEEGKGSMMLRASTRVTGV